MTLGSHNDRSAIELTGVTHVVQVFLRFVTQRSDIQIADCLLSADNSSSLATGSSLNMSNQVEQFVLIVCTSGGEVGHATEVLCRCIAPQSIHIVEQLLTEGLSHLVDKVVKVNTTRKHTVEFFVNLHNLQ